MTAARGGTTRPSGSHACSHPALPSGVQIDAVVLESPYTNIREAAAHIPVTKVSPGGSAHGVPQRWQPRCPRALPQQGEERTHQSHSLAPLQLSPWQIYRQFPGFGYLILDSLALGNMIFPSDEK